MTQKQTAVATMIETLDDTLCDYALSYIEFLKTKEREAKAQKVDILMSEINKMFEDDKGWVSEEEMIADLADFRRKREGLA